MYICYLYIYIYIRNTYRMDFETSRTQFPVDLQGKSSLEELLAARFGVWGLGFGVWNLGFGVWGLGFRVWGLGFGVRSVLRLRGRAAYYTPTPHAKPLNPKQNICI